MDQRLAAMVDAQGGVVSTADAARLGLSPVQLDGFVRTGGLVRVRRAAYALRTQYVKADPQEGYRLRTKAILRTPTTSTSR